MILVVDGNNMAVAANSVSKLTTQGGFPTQAIVGFLKSLHSMAATFEPTKIFIAWDGSRSPKRMALLNNTYKAGRKEAREKTPEQIMLWEEFRLQLPVIKEILGHLGRCIQMLPAPGTEADDSIAYLAKTITTSGSEELLIASNDKDFVQLVNPRVSLYRFSADKKLITAHNAESVMGLRPDQWVEFKAMWGDSSDEIPGVPGVGEKTAMSFLKEHGNIMNLLTYLRVKPKLTKREQAVLDHFPTIATNKLVMDLVNPCDCPRINFAHGEHNPSAFSAAMLKYEVKSIHMTLYQWIGVFDPSIPNTKERGEA